MLCFGSPDMQEKFLEIKTWSPSDIRTYAEYLNKWPLLDYSLRYLKEHHDHFQDHYAQDEHDLVHIATLIRSLTHNYASHFFGSWIAFRFRQTKSIPGLLKNSVLRRERAKSIPRVLKDLVLRREMSIKLRQPSLTHNDRVEAERFHWDILNAATDLGLDRVVQCLLILCTEDVGREYNETPPLIIAAQKGLVPATRLLLEQTQFINATDSKGRTALHHAAAIINEEIMSLLVERGADKRIQDDDGATAQHLVVKNL